MEDTGILISRTLVYYFKNCNTPSLDLLDLKVVLVTMLIEWQSVKPTYSKEYLS